MVRSRETHPIRVHTAIKDAGGCRKAPRLSHWLKNVDEQSVILAYAPPAKRRRVLEMCRRMMALADTASGTTTPGHDTLAEALGCSERTIHTYLMDLIAEGFLVRVAEGRSAEFIPKASITAEGGVKGTRWGGADAVTNERAVYAFTEPLTNLTLEVMGSEDVDNSCYPTTPEECFNPTHARESELDQKAHGYAATEKRSKALSERGGQDFWEDRSVPSYPRHATTSAQTKRGTRENELRAAATLQRRAFLLRRMGTKHLAYVCRPWFEAGCTVADIQHMLENRPDGGRIAHDWGRGIVHVAPWVRSLLMHWWAGGKPMYSPSQLREKGRAPLFARPVTAS